jgi:hypothetical protein
MQVYDYSTEKSYCLEHFKAVDPSIMARPSKPAPGLTELADAASTYREPIECPDIFSPYPLAVDPTDVLGVLDSMFTTSWDLFYDLRN